MLYKAKRTKLPLIYIKYIKKTPKLYLIEHAIQYRISQFQLYLKCIFLRFLFTVKRNNRIKIIMTRNYIDNRVQK